ncbi:MAG: alanine racemase [Candidatus Kerfeldbacteria bacterium]|nr:alanine racemase [Candidatus Kerfeldbacteria bacterium]
MKQALAHSWVEISERALVSNIRAHRRLLGSDTKLLAVVKSNAYGHGLELVARVAQKSGQVDWLGVASLREAMALRQAGIRLPILVLSYYHPLSQPELKDGIKHNVSFMVYELKALKTLAQVAQQVATCARVHLKLETGMARLGVSIDKAKSYLRYILRSPYLKLEGIASHFATAESRDQTFLKQQLNTYKKFIKQAGGLVPQDTLQHIAGTAASTAAPEARLSLVRLGIGLYGLWPSAANRQFVQARHHRFRLQPSLTWKTQIIEVQDLPPGTAVGYDRTYVTGRATRMAVMPVGYWDGYDRALSNKGRVLIHGTLCPVIGRICMNIFMADVTGLKNVKVGDEVVLIGKQGRGELTADDMADKTGTINYEIVTRINPLLPRVLV